VPFDKLRLVARLSTGRNLIVDKLERHDKLIVDRQVDKSTTNHDLFVNDKFFIELKTVGEAPTVKFY
jgi:hypothetical protein